MKPIYELTPISDHAKEMLAYIDNAKKENKFLDSFINKGVIDCSEIRAKGPPLSSNTDRQPAYTQEQVKGLEAMYGHNRRNLVVAEIKRETSVQSYRNCSLVISKEKIESLKGVFFEDCIIEFCNQDFSGLLINQGCRFKNCRIICRLNVTKVEYTLNEE